MGDAMRFTSKQLIFLLSTVTFGVVSAFRLPSSIGHAYQDSSVSELDGRQPHRGTLRGRFPLRNKLASECRRSKFAGVCALSMIVGDPYTAVMIVPTGIGASIGGYAGDALPSARLLSSVVDILITHPNVLNGAMLSKPMENVLYVEGFALDQFSAGVLGLNPTTKGGQKIGLLLDSAIEEDLLVRHLQVADAARATLGIDVAECVVTSAAVGVKIHISESGASWGSIENSDTLIEGAEKLMEGGCTAIAVVVRFPEDEDIEDKSDGSSGLSAVEAAARFEAYRKGEGVDGIAGAEALISHIITKELSIPCAHAPAFEGMLPDNCVSPKAAAEELGYTFLPCVLSYLHRAPSLIVLNSKESEEPKRGINDGMLNFVFTESGVKPEAPKRMRKARTGSGDVTDLKNVIIADNVDAVVVPANALGGASVLSFLSRHLESVTKSGEKEESVTMRRNGKKEVLIIAVEENETAMRVTAPALLSESGEDDDLFRNVVYARSYAECAGILAAHKAGILLSSISSFVPRIKVTRM